VPEGGKPIFTLYAVYSSKVDGVAFTGEYEEAINEAEGQHLLRSLKNGPRYHPHRSYECVLDPYRDIRPTQRQ